MYTKDGSKEPVKRENTNDSKYQALKEIRAELFNKKKISFEQDIGDYNEEAKKKLRVPIPEDSDFEDNDSSSEEAQQDKMIKAIKFDVHGVEMISDDESQISELEELTEKVGMKPLAKRSERYLSVGLSVFRKGNPPKSSANVIAKGVRMISAVSALTPQTHNSIKRGSVFPSNI